MKTIDVSLSIENYPHQQAVFDALKDHLYVIVPKGRRAGFTVGAANDFIQSGLAGTFKQGLWGDVVNSNIEKYISRLFIPELSKLPKRLWKWDKDPHVIHIKDSYIDFRSAERPESWEGFGYDKALLNEAGIILKNLYLYEHAIKPMLWDTNCHIVIGGTPKGKGKFFELYQRGLDPNQPSYKAVRMSPFDNPYINHQRIYEDMKDMSELAIKQEIYGEFLDDSGIVFRNMSQIAVLDPNDHEAQKPIGDHTYVIGCDLAKLQDFTVIVVYDRSTNNQVFQMRFNKLEWPYIRARIADVSKKYNRALIMLDSTGVGEPIYDDLSRMGLPVEGVKFTNTVKKDLINKLSNWTELNHLKMLKLEETIQEFNNFGYDVSEKTDRVYFGAPPGFHDDIVCFIKGTRILTNKGQLPIEKIKIGDMVMTRKGYKPVVNVMSRIKEIITNKQLGLTGTMDHPIFTKLGIKSLENVCETDIIYMWNEKLLSIEEKSIIDIQPQKEHSLEIIFGDMINGKSRPLRFIDRFGLIILGQYLKDLLFIIKMEILSIINLITSSFLIKGNIIDTICYLNIIESGQAKMEKDKLENFWKAGGNGEKIIQSWHTNLRSKMAKNTEEMPHLKDGARKNKRVYNLTIADEPEYFANNILVHNCAHALAVWSLQPVLQTKPVKEMTTIEKDMYELTHKSHNDFDEYEDSQYEPLDI